MKLDDREPNRSNMVGDTSTFAIGDLHGEVTPLTRLIQRLAPRLEDTLIFLSDYLDSGENAIGL